ncbi:class I SAM-dependent methyltransferase [bacterium]|nr:class I SAM-dependent methyltransferase [bacterium]
MKSIWDRRAKRYRIRGLSGPGKVIALSEWKAAARLWNEYMSSVSGWTIDIGAGNGGFWDLVKRPENLVCLDISTGFVKNPDINRVVANAINPPFSDCVIECIVALGLTEYLTDIEEVFSKWRNLVSDGGKILFTGSPPLLMNRLRKLFSPDVNIRNDDEIVKMLQITGWRLLHPKPVHAGWQSLFVAEAV